MIVMKFGGSSLKDSESIRNVAQIIKPKLSLQPVIVASALGKTTRNLLNSSLAASMQNQTDSQNIYETVKVYHFNIAEELGLLKTNVQFKKDLSAYFSEIESNLQKIQSDKNLSPKLQDATLSYGELLSTLILSAYLEVIGINTKLLDARDCIITDEHFTHSTPLESESFGKIERYLRPVINEDKVAIIQGFIGSTQSGDTTTLGFEGSDFSAVLIGVALKADEVQIWKDVPGVMSADPAKIPKAIPVENMTYAEAAELSRCGAQVLHPSTIRPASDLNIPVKIFNSRQPDFRGTTIDNQMTEMSNSIKSVTCRKNLIILQISAKQSLSEFDFSAQVFVILRDLEISPEIIEGSDKKIILILNKSEFKEEFINQITQWADVDIEESKATISLIGHMIRTKQSVLNKIQKYKISQSMQFDVDKTSEHSYTI
ncbi:MAG TPA: aspartate kinase, partial [Caldithrix sp.]|nr:aspartate kinase [Caldithrix sp.]